MKNLSHRYQKALRAWIHDKGGLKAGARIGRAAALHEVGILQVAGWHEKAVNAEGLAQCNGGGVATMRKASRFFVAAIGPIERAQRKALKEGKRMSAMKEAFSRNSKQMALSGKRLKLEILRRSQVEGRLAESEKTYNRLLENSGRHQDELRLLSRHIISAHESERRQISRDLHDHVASALAGINGELNELKNDVAGESVVLKRRIAKAQRLVERSVEGVHQFARALRPPALDDLGLGPALHTLVKSVSSQCDITLRLDVQGSIRALDNEAKTALYRVAQEALNNVIKHARAQNASVALRRRGLSVEMKVSDDGKGVAAADLEHGKAGRRLGILGMSERISMVGGSFHIESVQGKGTTVLVSVPARPAPKQGAPCQTR